MTDKVVFQKLALNLKPILNTTHKMHIIFPMIFSCNGISFPALCFKILLMNYSIIIIKKLKNRIFKALKLTRPCKIPPIFINFFKQGSYTDLYIFNTYFLIHVYAKLFNAYYGTF